MEITYHIDDITTVANKVAKNLSSKTILFYGAMGVGKTTFIKALAATLGSIDTVNSPTFSIVNEYELKNDVIYHFDLYRIKDEQEALNFGIEDYLMSNHYIFIEWPEKISDLLPKQAEIISIVLNNDASRTLKWTKNHNLTNNIAMEHKFF
ncbi:MAG: tRNA (adenosine(37)-N6)-threonylcarbamoyltransferase complex ATPase subunit type 1 TsaE [Gelidibacter sp.]